MSSPLPSFDPREFFEVARRLREGTSEDDWRSAISRSYYAAFLSTRERFVLSGAITLTSTGQDHALVARIVRSRSFFRGRQLERLRRLRSAADYNLDRHISHDEVDEAILLVEALLSFLRN